MPLLVHFSCFSCTSCVKKPLDSWMWRETQYRPTAPRTLYVFLQSKGTS